jgi:SET domain-containing protein
MEERVSKTVHPLVKVARTSTGFGLVAIVAIPRGTKIIQYVGPILNYEESDKKAGMYLFEISPEKFIDGSSRSNIARYANHACRPNSQAYVYEDDEIWIEAEKNIKPGEQITINYGRTYFDLHIRPKGCRCATCSIKNLSE